MAKRARKNSTARTIRSTSAPDAYRGFSLQATRFLYYLLKAEQDDVVSLEYFEDVGVERPDGTRLAEQAKSYTSRNPLSDRSLSFWKTLRNWVEAAHNEMLRPSTTRFVAYAPKAEMKDIVLSFHNATTVEQARQALSKARETLATADGWDISTAAHPHLTFIFNADPDLVAQVLTRLTVDTTPGNPPDALKPLLHDKLVGEDSIDDVLRWAHGWIKQRTDNLLKEREPARIVKRDFHQALLNYVRTHDRLNILRSVAGRPSDDEVAQQLSERIYVSQLRIIDLDDVDVLSAVNDFLAAAIDRTIWSDRGMISEDSLETLERELTATWRNKQRRTTLAFGERDGKEQGQFTFLECMEHEACIDGLETPRHFIRGSWHALADDFAIGWHPQYKGILATLSEPGQRSPEEL